MVHYSLGLVVAVAAVVVMVVVVVVVAVEVQTVAAVDYLNRIVYITC